MRYRKKPIVIEAIHLEDNMTPALAAEWCGGKPAGVGDLSAKQWIEISTLEGVMKAEYGDWIIKGVKGEFYPCKPDIFEATYVAVDESEEKLLNTPVLKHRDGSFSYLTKEGLDLLSALK